MKFREFQVEKQISEGNEYIVISQKKSRGAKDKTHFVVIEKHQIKDILNALKSMDEAI